MPMSGNDSTHIPTKTVRHDGTAMGRHRIKGRRIGLEHPAPVEKSWTEREKNAIMQRMPPRGERKNKEKAKNDPAEQGKNITTTAD